MNVCDAAAIRKKYAGVDNIDALGQGVSGTVKVVTRKSDGAKFALKIMRIGSNSATGLQQIKDEVMLLASTDHPNVARLYETFEEKGSNFYLVMELCTGGELFDRLLGSEDSHFTEAVAANVVLQMLLSINYIHSKNLVHRDLKLENFIFATKDADSPLKMIDFGFSKKVTSMDKTRMSQVVGTSYYIAPEVLDHDYTAACDLWSLGVITYMLLSGSPPFGGDDDGEIMENVRTGEYTMHQPVWANVSEDAKDFINSLLVMNADDRMTAKDALKHRWITKAESEHPKTPLDIKVAQNMLKFRSMNKLKKLAVSTVAFSLSPDQIMSIQKQFLDMDEDHDGFVTMKELRTAIAETGAMSPDEVDKMFESLDETNDGKIELSEFVSACLDKKTYMDEARLMEAFTKLDADGSGGITKQDLKMVLGSQFEDEEAQRMIDEAGGSDGQIDYTEFVSMMRKQHQSGATGGDAAN
jgi:calcium-dependent protein kinase